MAKRRLARGSKQSRRDTVAHVSSPVDRLLLAALDRGSTTLETGRYLVTFKEGAAKEGIRSLTTHGLRLADSADFVGQATNFERLGDADGVVFREVGVALLGSGASDHEAIAADIDVETHSAIGSVQPEYFVFAEDIYGGRPAQYVRDRDDTKPGEMLFPQPAHTLEEIVSRMALPFAIRELHDEAAATGTTWGLSACRVPASVDNGVGIRVAILGTGLDLGHPDFAHRAVVTETFVGEPVQDLNGHGTHMAGTACGPKAPFANTPRYGIASRAQMFVGKILSNSGGGTTATVLSGMNWAINNRCEVIFLPLSSAGGPQPVYTAAGQAALNNGLLMIAGSSNPGPVVGAPANSPTVMSIGSLDLTLTPSAFSPTGKIDIVGPGRDILASWSRPVRYKTISGLATAAAHVAGCAGLWAQHLPSLRGQHLWNALQRSAKSVPFAATRVGAGLVQAP